MDKKTIKDKVREGYGKIARSKSSCGCGSSCCGSNSADVLSKNVGYSKTEISTVPDGANLGLGCGNPTALAALNEGETVLDLGSGAGFDSFLAAKKVGKKGKVIGVDMTPEMVDKAKYNAVKGGYDNVEFKLGEIENLPLKDSTIDVIVSNCVINLSPEKEKVFTEAFRVLKNGGRIMVSDIVLLKELPQKVRDSVNAYIGCLAGAIKKDKYIEAMRSAGFKDIIIVSESVFPLENMANDATAKAVAKEADLTEKDIIEIGSSVASIKVQAYK